MVKNAIPGFENMTAYQRGISLIEEYGFWTSLTPTLHGATLGIFTRDMSWHAHLPSVETVVIGTPILYGWYTYQLKPFFKELFSP
jgi:hypothetical protein